MASSVANTPVANEPASLRLAPRSDRKPGSGISNQPHRFAANTTTTTAMPERNHGFWNCRPQPTASPASLRPARAAASSRNAATIPADVARKAARTSPCARASSFTTLASFIASTGSTQGIRFRISPPRSATASIASSVVGGPAGGAVPSVTLRSTARAPSTSVSVTCPPAAMGAAPGPAAAGIVSVAARPPSAKRATGLAKLQPAGPST